MHLIKLILLLPLMLGGILGAHDAHDLTALRSMPAVIPLLVLGSGPAGLTAGMYGARAKVPTLVITGAEPGGQLTGAGEVENMPGVSLQSGEAIMANLRKQAIEHGALIMDDSAIDVDFTAWPFKITTQEHGVLRALTLIVATGAAPRKLGIPGEVEYWSAGVSACSICDCFLFKDKEVAIVGGGDAAVEHASNLIPYAKKITIFVRKDRMRAAPKMQERIIDHEKVTIVYNKELVEVLGNGTYVTGLIIRDSITGQQELFATDGLFLAIGHNPNSALLKGGLELSHDGYIVLKTRSQQTDIKGVFAAGDVSDSRFRQAGIASGSGIQAALEAVEFLRAQGIDDRELKRLSIYRLDDTRESLAGSTTGGR